MTSAPLQGWDSALLLTLHDAKAEFIDLDLHFFRHHSTSSTFVAVFRGDVAADSLDLDFDNASVEPDIGLIIVTGDVHVTSWIANQQTDGAISLAVCGDLHAGQVAIGGQELFVGGSLVVDGFFCGSYNHGQAVIRGDLQAGCVITDDYRIWVGGHVNAPITAPGETLIFRGSDQKARADLRPHLTYEVPLPLLLGHEFFDDDGLSFPTLEASMRHQQLLVPTVSPVMVSPTLALTQVGDEIGLSPRAAHIAHVQSLPMFADAVERFEAYDGDDYFRLVRPHVDTDGEHTDGSAYVETADEKFWFFRSGEHCVAYRAHLGAPLESVAPEPADPEWIGCCQVFLRFVRYFLTLQEMQIQTPPDVVEGLVAGLLEDHEDEAEIAWYTLTRADPPDSDGDVINGTRLFVMNGHLSFTYEVTQGVCLRYVESDLENQRFPIPVTHQLQHQFAVLHFQGAAKFLTAVAARRADT